MKNPALTKVLSAALAVLCAVMIGFGISELGKAGENYENGVEAAENLAKKIDTFRELDALLTQDPLNYEAVMAERDGLSAQFDRDSAEHKAALAEFTASKGGTEMGSLALDSAAYALQVGKREMEAGLAEFQKQLGDYAFLMDCLPTEEEISCITEAVAKAEEEFLSRGDRLTELENKLAELREQGVSEVTVEELRELLASLCEECRALETEETKLSAEHEERLSELALVDTVTAEVTAELTADGSAAPLPSEEEDGEIYPGFTFPDAGEIAARVEERILALTGKTVEAIKTEAAACRQRLCELRERLAELRRRIEEADGKLDNFTLTLDELQCALNEARECYECAGEKLSKAKELYDKVLMAIRGKAMLDEAQAAIEAGEIEIATAWYQLRLTKDGFADREQELAEERDRIESDRAALSELDAQLNDHDSLSNRWRRARNVLKMYPELKERFEAGEDVITCAMDELAAMRENNARDHRIALAIAVLCIAAGVFGILTVPGSFELMKTYPYILIAGALCFLCAAGAEALGVYAGRGQTYAALAGAVFALLYLPVARPERKRH